MDDLDLTKFLDGNGPAATPEVLGRIVARRRQQRARQHRVVTTTAVVVALACAGIGVRLDQHAGTASAVRSNSSASSAPAGLKWVVQHGSQSATQFAAVPGQFGFSSNSHAPDAQNSGSTYGAATASPSVAPVTGAGKGKLPSSCVETGCDVVFNSGMRPLFTRHVDGLTVVVSLALFDYPSTIATGHVSLPASLPTSPRTASSPPAASSPTGTGTSPPGTVTPVTAQPLPNIVPRSVIHVTMACPVESELVVEVSDGSVTRTLSVPAGGATDHPFSVVASAGATFGSAGSVVIAVARTTSSVSSVSARFPGGGSDSMAPKQGWAVLAQHLPAGTSLSRASPVTLAANAASGRVLESVQLPATGSLAAAPLVALCRFLVVPLNVVSPPTGPPSSTSGASTGSSGSSGSVAGGQPTS